MSRIEGPGYEMHGKIFFYVSCKFVVKTLPLGVTDTDSIKKEIQYMSYSPKSWFVGVFLFGLFGFCNPIYLRKLVLT